MWRQVGLRSILLLRVGSERGWMVRGVNRTEMVVGEDDMTYHIILGHMTICEGQDAHTVGIRWKVRGLVACTAERRTRGPSRAGG
jgi:hypothetical protein